MWHLGNEAPSTPLTHSARRQIGIAASLRRLRYVAGALALSLAIVATILALRAVQGTAAVPPPECTGGQSLEFSCFAARYAALTRVSGAEAALDDLAERRKTNRYLVATCHQLTHVVGRTAGELHGAAAFARGSAMCSSGYYHGVTEAVMMKIGRARILDEAGTVCARQRQGDDRAYPHYNCVHGMGHGFMAVFDSDVFESLAGCDALPDAWEQRHCYGGVFMENLTAINDPSRPSKHLRRDEPLYPCTAVERRYKDECYVQQTAYAVYVNNSDFAAVFRLCRDAADVEFRGVCYQGIGGDAAIFGSKYVIGLDVQARAVRTLCRLGPDAGARSNCVAGAVTTIVRSLAGDDTKARALCGALEEPDLARVCETTREDAIRGVPTSGRPHQHQ
jgi:hypothetical protein